ncbi:hypothetical protein BDDG_13352, partial [Blastomyces dermatitidis ATCC 18188]
RAAPDQSYRLFRYTPQIPRTLRSSAILDCRSSAATNAYALILGHSRSPILGCYKRVYILPPRSSITYTYKYSP